MPEVEIIEAHKRDNNITTENLPKAIKTTNFSDRDPETNAKIGLWISIFGFLFFFFLLSIVGLIFSIDGLKSTDKRLLTVSGIALSIITIFVSTLLLVCFL
ncbi:MAG: hypothetical protein KBE91_02315 [Bacteroidia bacterium]|nr:hypothetical protein [Bacteroidia bacterium]